MSEQSPQPGIRTAEAVVHEVVGLADRGGSCHRWRQPLDQSEWRHNAVGSAATNAICATESTPSETPAQSDFEVIYGENEAINRFIVAFNKTPPTDALTAGDLTIYNHHGRGHEDQVQTQISGADVVISEDNFSDGAYHVSAV